MMAVRITAQSKRPVSVYQLGIVAGIDAGDVLRPMQGSQWRRAQATSLSSTLPRGKIPATPGVYCRRMALRVEKISAVTFRVLNMEASVQFHRDVLAVRGFYDKSQGSLLVREHRF
jgi:hypothetical protein